MADLLKIRDVARMLKLQPWVIYKMVKENSIPVIRIGRNVRFDPDDIGRWIDSQKQAVADGAQK